MMKMRLTRRPLRLTRRQVLGFLHNFYRFPLWDKWGRLSLETKNSTILRLTCHPLRQWFFQMEMVWYKMRMRLTHHPQGLPRWGQGAGQPNAEAAGRSTVCYTTFTVHCTLHYITLHYITVCITFAVQCTLSNMRCNTKSMVQWTGDVQYTIVRNEHITVNISYS